MKIVSKLLLLVMMAFACVSAGTGEISIGAHFNNGTGANLGYARILDSKWLWSMNFDYGLMELVVMDAESNLFSTKTETIVALMEFKFEVGKKYDITPTLDWKWIGGAGVAVLDGTLDGMPGKDRSMWAIPLEVHLTRYTDDTKDFGFFAGFNMTVRKAMDGELYDEIGVITPQARGGIVF